MILKITNDNLYDLIINIHGFSDITTTKFVNNLDEFKIFFDKLNKLYDLSHLINNDNIDKNNNEDNNEDSNKDSDEDSNEDINKNNDEYILKDKKIVFTGFRDNLLEDYIIKNGGKISTSVSKNTDLLVYSETTSSKYDKAISLNIEIIHIDNFYKLINFE